MLTILPALPFRMPGSTACTKRTAPKKLVSNWALASARLVSSAAPVSAYPALLTSTSSRQGGYRQAWVMIFEGAYKGACGG